LAKQTQTISRLSTDVTICHQAPSTNGNPQNRWVCFIQKGFTHPPSLYRRFEPNGRERAQNDNHYVKEHLNLTRHSITNTNPTQAENIAQRFLAS
jgi:hypothetical protein